MVVKVEAREVTGRDGTGSDGIGLGTRYSVLGTRANSGVDHLTKGA